MPRDPSKPYIKLRTEDLLKMISIAQIGGVSPVMQAALVSRAMQMPGGVAAGNVDIDSLKTMVLSLGKVYSRSRVTLPGICLSILEDRSLISELRDEQDVHPPAERLSLSRDLAQMIVAELRQCVSEGKVMVPEFEVTIGALDWQATQAHLDYGKQVLLSGASVELRRAGLAFVCPATIWAKQYRESGREERLQAARVLVTALGAELDANLREEIASDLSVFASDDDRIVQHLESVLQSGTLSPEMVAAIREELETVRRRAKPQSNPED
jgi:hypothetical protein